ncbi:hypothetical protein ACIDI_86c00010 [Acidiphilium sp. JA12-A1]|nr:hypothetical protein ACIDI_86c00010 [Acidiphilium sp. JA12-A1]
MYDKVKKQIPFFISPLAFIPFKLLGPRWLFSLDRLFDPLRLRADR